MQKTPCCDQPVFGDSGAACIAWSEWAGAVICARCQARYEPQAASAAQPAVQMAVQMAVQPAVQPRTPKSVGSLEVEAHAWVSASAVKHFNPKTDTTLPAVANEAREIVQRSIILPGSEDEPEGMWLDIMWPAYDEGSPPADVLLKRLSLQEFAIIEGQLDQLTLLRSPPSPTQRTLRRCVWQVPEPAVTAPDDVADNDA